MLAGGLGTRLGELTQSCPKPLLPVSGRPFLEYVLCSCLQFPVTTVVLAIGYLGEQVEQVIGREFRGVPVRYVSDGGALGTGGVFRLAARGSRAEQLLVMNGDTLARLDAGRLLEFHRTGDADTTFSLKPVGPVPGTRHDPIAVDDHGRIVDKGGSTAIAGVGVNCGVTIVERESVLQSFPEGVSRFEDVLLMRESNLACYGWLGVSAFLDIGVPADFEVADEFVAEG